MQSQEKRYVREARKDELGPMCELARRAFHEDPEFNYFGSRKTPLPDDPSEPGSKHLKTFFAFLIKSCWLAKGHVMVAVVKDEGEGDEQERVAAFCLWLPPGRRLSNLTVVRGGVLGVIKNWKLNGLIRIAVEYTSKSESALAEAFRAKGVKKSHSQSWYLLLACTDPAHQGKGLMSMLIRGAFEKAPSDIFTHEATTEKSRDQYAHWGYQVVKPIVMGAKKVKSDGLPPNNGEKPTGFTIYSMVKWSGK